MLCANILRGHGSTINWVPKNELSYRSCFWEYAFVMLGVGLVGSGVGSELKTGKNILSQEETHSSCNITNAEN